MERIFTGYVVACSNRTSGLILRFAWPLLFTCPPITDETLPSLPRGVRDDIVQQGKSPRLVWSCVFACPALPCDALPCLALIPHSPALTLPTQPNPIQPNPTQPGLLGIAAAALYHAPLFRLVFGRWAGACAPASKEVFLDQMKKVRVYLRT